MNMAGEIYAPTDRLCEVCGRSEQWNEEDGRWAVDEDPGRVYCIHQWDITGDFVPINTG